MIYIFFTKYVYNKPISLSLALDMTPIAQTEMHIFIH